MSRTARVERATSETKLVVEIDLDGTGVGDISTGVGFYDHMLTALAKHSGIDLTVRADGDLHIDAHHTVEDVAIALGQAFAEALGDKKGITRYGDATIPMGEGLVQAAVDPSGRPGRRRPAPATRPSGWWGRRSGGCPPLIGRGTRLNSVTISY